MNKQVEKWALIAILICGSVVLMGEFLDGKVVRSMIWLAAVVAVGFALVKDRRSRAREQ